MSATAVIPKTNAVVLRTNAFVPTKVSNDGIILSAAIKKATKDVLHKESRCAFKDVDGQSIPEALSPSGDAYRPRTMDVENRHRILFETILPVIEVSVEMKEAARQKIGHNYIRALVRNADLWTEYARNEKQPLQYYFVSMQYKGAAQVSRQLGDDVLAAQYSEKSAQFHAKFEEMSNRQPAAHEGPKKSEPAQKSEPMQVLNVPKKDPKNNGGATEGDYDARPERYSHYKYANETRV